MSAKQQFGVPALLMLARKRGIFLSDQDDRDELADKISILPFGFYELGVIQAEFERAGAGVKTTSFRIPTVLTLAEIKTITEQYTAVATAEGDTRWTGVRFDHEGSAALECSWNDSD